MILYILDAFLPQKLCKLTILCYNKIIFQLGDEIMPLVNIKMLEGRTLEQKRELVEKVTQAVVTSTGATPENVSIVIEEMARDNFAQAGVLASEK